MSRARLERPSSTDTRGLQRCDHGNALVVDSVIASRASCRAEDKTTKSVLGRVLNENSLLGTHTVVAARSAGSGINGNGNRLFGV